MRRALVLLASAAVLTGLAVPAAADAAHYAPPGKAGATQYFETIPTSGGNVAPPSYNPKAPSSSSTSAATSTPATSSKGKHGSKRLSAMGTDGQAAANFANSSSPNLSSGVSAQLQADPGGSAIGGLMNLLTGSDAGGIGLMMPLLLGLSLLAALAFAGYRAARR